MLNLQLPGGFPDSQDSSRQIACAENGLVIQAMNCLFGAAVSSPAKARGNAVSTVERGAAAGSVAYLLASVSGDLATPAIEISSGCFPC